MDEMELKHWLGGVASLTTRQKAELLKALGADGNIDPVRALVESRLTTLPECPHCGGDRTVRNGNASGLQRYKCRACRRTFNALSTTPLARLRMKAKWLKHRTCCSKA